MFYRILLLLSFILSSNFDVLAQNVVFSSIPQDMQLFARDANNQADVRIAGKVNQANITGLSFIMKRGTASHSYKKVPIGSNGLFDVTIPIQSVYNTDYTLTIFSFVGKDSTQIATRKNILCGDVIVVMGQSNALFGVSLQNGNARAYGKMNYGNTYNPADTTWVNTYATESLFSSIGAYLGNQILTKSRVPVCLIVGGDYGYPIQYFLRTQEQIYYYFVDNLTGKVAYKVWKGGYRGKVKAVVWWHGESASAGSFPLRYGEDFDKLYKQWQRDSIVSANTKVITMQVNLLKDWKINEAGDVRETQRKFQQKYPNVEVIASTGLAGYDGLHYTSAGYEQAASEIYRILYANTTAEAKSPDIQRILYENKNKEKIHLFFGEGQKMTWTDEVTLKHSKTGANYKSTLRNYFYSGTEHLAILSGEAKDNVVSLQLFAPQQLNTLTYLPDWYVYDSSEFFQGPFLKNSLGMRALTFKNFPVTLLSSPNTLVATPQSSGVELSWQKNTNDNVQFGIERSENDSLSFIPLATVSSTTYTDKSYTSTNKHYYRIKNVLTGTSIESDYSNLASSTPIALKKENVANAEVTITPNPTSGYVEIILPYSNSKPTNCNFYHNDGKLVDSFEIPAGETHYTYTVKEELSSGIYVLNFPNVTIPAKKIVITR